MGRLLSLCLVAPLLWTLPALSGCAPELGEIPFLCNQGKPQCPDGYECMGRYCVKEGTCPESLPECGASSCGNGQCDGGEDSTSCPADCTATCGNEKCETGEDGKSCPTDCPISTCGDKKCDVGETNKNCPMDCPAVCGDTICDLGENSQTCPKDCAGSVCGDKKCDPGETATSCPGDCSTVCTGDVTKCEGTDKLNTCVIGQWKTEECAAQCQTGGFQYSSGCQFSASKGKDVCVCGNYVKFGGMCDDTKKCDPALFCGTFGTSSKGFCTKYCTGTSGCTGAPAGTYASCSLSIGTKMACGFECDFLTPCPTGLVCDDPLGGTCRP